MAAHAITVIGAVQPSEPTGVRCPSELARGVPSARSGPQVEREVVRAMRPGSAPPRWGLGGQPMRSCRTIVASRSWPTPTALMRAPLISSRAST